MLIYTYGVTRPDDMSIVKDLRFSQRWYISWDAMLCNSSEVNRRFEAKQGYILMVEEYAKQETNVKQVASSP
jgi:hypothetical protein